MIRCGFFNSVNNDRTYDAEDMGKIFEGIISDGVFNNINKGNSFKVTKVNNTITVNVAAGKAWFYNRYFEIVGSEIVTLRGGDVNPRIDTICIKIDTSSSVREGTLYVEEGQPDATPHRPTITNTEDIKYLPIADILIPANAVNVNSATIANLVGTLRCPYSETTLDPRRAMYVFEGESQEEPPILKFKVRSYIFDVLIDHTSASNNVLSIVKYIPFTELGFDESVVADEDFIKKNKFIINYADRQPIACNPNGQTSQGYSLLGNSEYILNPIFWEYSAANGNAHGLHVRLGYKKPSGGTINDGFFRIEVIVMESTYEEEN